MSAFGPPKNRSSTAASDETPNTSLRKASARFFQNRSPHRRVSVRRRTSGMHPGKLRRSPNSGKTGLKRPLLVRTADRNTRPFPVRRPEFGHKTQAFVRSSRVSPYRCFPGPCGRSSQRKDACRHIPQRSVKSAHGPRPQHGIPSRRPPSRKTFPQRPKCLAMRFFTAVPTTATAENKKLRTHAHPEPYRRMTEDQSSLRYMCST